MELLDFNFKPNISHCLRILIMCEIYHKCQLSLKEFKWLICPQPLNPNPESVWSQYFKDNEMLLQIDKDCR